MIHSLPLDIRCVWDSASGLLFMISILLTKSVEVNSFSEKSGKTEGKKKTDAPKTGGIQLARQKRTGNMTTSKFWESFRRRRKNLSC